MAKLLLSANDTHFGFKNSMGMVKINSFVEKIIMILIPFKNFHMKSITVRLILFSILPFWGFNLNHFKLIGICC